MALWLEWTLIVLLVLLSGLFSGLNLGLMGLDPVDLEVVMSGSEPNASFARQIRPLRQQGNWLLCTLLLGNVAVNAGLSILLADKADAVIGFIASTGIIVVFGEIIPQALCSRHALWIGAKTRLVVWFLMVIIAILAYPIAMMLDWILGDELGTIYSTSELKKLVDIHAKHEGTKMDAPTANIMKGALDLQETTVGDVMTKIDDVFWLPSDTKLTFDVLTNIFKSGHSRIPIMKKSVNSKRRIEGVLYAKDLVLLDPDDEIAVQHVMNAFRYKKPVSLSSRTRLDECLKIFVHSQQHLCTVRAENEEERIKRLDSEKLRSGEPLKSLLHGPKALLPKSKDSAKVKEHSLPKQQSNYDSEREQEAERYEDRDDQYDSDMIHDAKSKPAGGQFEEYLRTYHSDRESSRQDRGRNDPAVIGIITLEDVIEHALQTQLVDEHDVFVDSKHAKLTNRLKRIDWSMLQMFDHRQKILTSLPPQELQAVYHFFTQSVRVFMPKHRKCSESAIKNLLVSSSVLRVVVGDSQSEAIGHRRDPYKQVEDNGMLLYQRDKKTEYFTLILDGKCEIYAGKQGFRSVLTRWTYMCPDALYQVQECVQAGKPMMDYVPDFTCKVVEDARILRIKLSDFKACIQGKFDEFDRTGKGRDVSTRMELLPRGKSEPAPLRHSAAAFINVDERDGNNANVEEFSVGQLDVTVHVADDSETDQSSGLRYSSRNSDAKR